MTQLGARTPSYAKLNKCLLVGKPRPDGMHPIWSVFQTISLADTLTMEKTTTPGEWALTCSNPDVPCDERNLLSQIIAPYLSSLSFGIRVHIDKQIPIGGGLGGGSSNAGVFLNWLNEAAGWNKSPEKLKEEALPYGSDIPFFIQGGTALVEEVGNQITKLDEPDDWWGVLINPNLHSDTAKVYHKFDSMDLGRDTFPESIDERALYQGTNDLTPAITACLPDLEKLSDWVQFELDREFNISGSGATCFIDCDNEKDATRLATLLKSQWPDYWIKSVHSV
ncbi:4-(cytidine 5'-diphospho)-2-C-methyl-D-erythritol kinase [bacterium]|jgi:4-diphosphocytidyl-2-C-methyl-D-erythritol kinase|nr:4-(cytidine 5'-diphospho)-2-C-methyl-D-erythritol kinase [bacterium]